MEIQQSENAGINNAQKARAAALRRFNQLAVYLPLGIGGAICLGLLGWLMWASVIAPLFNREAANGGEVATLQSSLADAIFVLLGLPIFLTMLALPLLLLAGLLTMRQNDRAPLRWLQSKSWALENRIVQIKDRLHRVSTTTIRNGTAIGNRLEQTEHKIFRQLTREERGD